MIEVRTKIHKIKVMIVVTMKHVPHYITISLDEQWSITYSYSTMPGIYSSKQTKSPEDEVCS